MEACKSKLPIMEPLSPHFLYLTNMVCDVSPFLFFSPFGYFTLNLITISFNLLIIWLDLLIDFTRKLGWRCSWIRLCRTIRGESYLIFGLTMVLGLLIGFFAVNNVTHFVIGLSLALYQYLVLVCMLNMPFCAS